MVGIDKDKLGGIFKKKDDKSEKEDKLKKAKPTASKASTRGTSSKAKTEKVVSSKISKMAKDKKAEVEKNKAKREAFLKEKQEKVLHSKTHQDLINASYKAAEKLKTDPWLIMKNAGWSKLHEDRGKVYDGPTLDEMKDLPDDQKKALMDELGKK